MALRSCRAAVLACAIGLAGAGADAGGLQISTVGLTLTPEQAADGIWLINAGEGVMQAQVRVYRWTQEGDTDKLTPSQELVVSPPMLQIARGDKQLARIIRLGPPPGGPSAVEHAYRVIFDELPVNPDGKGKLNFVMRYSVPVFVAPVRAKTEAGAPRLAWALRRQGDRVILEVANGGTAHAQLAELSFLDAAGKRTALHSGLLGYVLPLARMRWMLKTPPAALTSFGILEARVNGENASQVVSLADLTP
jgi:fimbrial chaperone protein